MSSQKRESLLVFICVITAALVYWSADQIPVSLMAKISAGLVPKVIAVSLALLACLHLLLMVMKPSAKAMDDNQSSAEHVVSPNGVEEFSILRVAVSVILLAAFILCLDQGWLDFWSAACLFTGTGILLMSELSVRSVMLAVVVSLICVSSTVLLFTRVFTVILP